MFRPVGKVVSFNYVLLCCFRYMYIWMTWGSFHYRVSSYLANFSTPKAEVHCPAGVVCCIKLVVFVFGDKGFQRNGAVREVSS